MSRFDIEMPSLDFDEQERLLSLEQDEMSEEDYTAFYFEDDDRYETEYIHETLYGIGSN